MKTKDELCSELRAVENKNIISRRNKDRSNYMAFRLVIRNINNNEIINESSIFDTLCALCRLIGAEKMSESGVKNGRYQYTFVRNSGDSNCYRQANNGLWVLSKVSVLSVALALNELFDKLNVHYIAAIETRLT